MNQFTIPLLNKHLQADLMHKIDHKTKPLGSLGKLESVALQVGLIQHTLTPKLHNPTMLVFAADHGITQCGVSPYPQAVTKQMVQNFLSGGAAINVFAKLNKMTLRVIDAGINTHFEPNENLINAKTGIDNSQHGTANYLIGPAMTLTQCEQALTLGAKLASNEAKAGCNIIGFGEMGIGNTSSASCLMSVLCGLTIETCVGRGTGLNDEGLSKKTAILKKAIAFHSLNKPTVIHKHHDVNQQDCLNKQNIMQALATFGGFEIAMMVGAMLASAEKKCVLLIDGFIASAALLVAYNLQPNILEYCIFAHCSDEFAHRKMLEMLGVQPLLDLGLRLGEGTGAVLAYPLIQAAVNFLNEMASFESAGVSEMTSEMANTSISIAINNDTVLSRG